ncbi:MAG TPA: alpha/beta hydrolase [Allosphingosinicella sp.]|jgi:pimeloyl-ACP methyl ester carboxylesterase|nr:alpha/beta hydrolase [Allosphingosinicella sp.]
MTDLTYQRLALATGVTLNVASAGPGEGEPILFLHGFPESHRTWRHQLDGLSDLYRVFAPDQRGFAASDKPEGVENYETDRIVADVMALADALGLDRFTLAGHDWGGAVAWTAALTHPVRVKRLIIVNAPHPLVFQKSLIDDPAQREASQYISFFRSPAAEAAITGMGLENFLDRVMLSHADATKLPAEERRHYLDDWAQPGVLTTMLNWYRASKMTVPAPGEEAKAPLWTHAPFPKLKMPTLVVWGLKDTALLPVQLEGLSDLVEDLRLVTSPTGSHFITWEEPGTVTSAIRDFMAETAA